MKKGLMGNHIILGNQSGDMDSIASALALAEAMGPSFFPLINIPKEDLPLRQDVLLLFDWLTIDPSLFLYREDVPALFQAAAQGKIKIILIDHNVLAPSQKAFQPYVDAIFDHHYDEKISYPCLAPDKKIVMQAGSTATLVSEWILEHFREKMDVKRAQLLLAPLLLDTLNLKNPEKTTVLDTKIANRLIHLGQVKDPLAFYSQLYQKRKQVEGSPGILLRKDFKIYEENHVLYGISSLQSNWQADTYFEWEGELHSFLNKQQISIWFGLQAKSLIFYTSDPSFYKKFLSSFHLEDILWLMHSLPEEGLAFYGLKKLLARKELQPLLNHSITPCSP